MIRVLAWATHLQTDILALCAHLDASPDFELLIVTEQAAAYRTEPIARFMPLRAEILDRHDAGTMARVRAFGADVAIADNHLPPRGVAPRLFYMWHGLGWKARSRLDLKVFHRLARRFTGQDPRLKATRFRAQCYGPTDFAWRVDNWGIAPENCVVAGMCFSDVLRDPPYAKADLSGEYAIDILRRPTVMLSITWHYGGIFTRDGSEPVATTMERDLAFLRELAKRLGERGANLLICLHDRKRYDPAFLAGIETLTEETDRVGVRFKSDHPDNLADLLVADVMVSNLSSFLAYYYVLGRPSIQLLPAPSRTGQVKRVIMFLSRLRVSVRSRVNEMWMLDPEDTGGPNVRGPDAAIEAIMRALDPHAGNPAAGEWLDRHVMPIDGQACARMETAIRELASAS